MNKEYTIKNQVELEALLGAPKEAIKQKVISGLDSIMKDFVRRSPLVFIATSDKAGKIDISPKGDAPGFVQIDQSGNLLIPERPGNKLMFGFRNLLENSNISLIFVIPNTRETLRVKGNAVLSNDPALLTNLSAQGKVALLCTFVDVTECFFHCGKAMIRSQLWNPESWAQDEQLMATHFANKNKVDKSLVESNLEQSYRDNLY